MVFARSVPRVWRERGIKYRLIGGRCNSCGKVFYPYRRFCPRCGSEDIRKVELSRQGRVLYFTVIRTPPLGFEKYAPYVVAIVELADGARVITQLTDVDPGAVKEGIEVEAVFRKYREQGEDGIIEYGIKFRPKA